MPQDDHARFIVLVTTNNGTRYIFVANEPVDTEIRTNTYAANRVGVAVNTISTVHVVPFALHTVTRL